MPKFDFSIKLPAPTDKLIELATDYQNFVNYLPDQIKKVKILESNKDETLTEETLYFSTVLKNQVIEQRSAHKKIKPNELFTEIISGPFKGSKINSLYEKIESGSSISVHVDLKIPLKYKFLTPIIKKMYKIILTGILYKMNRIALESQQG